MLTKVSNNSLFQSEPHPSGFDNEENDSKNPHWSNKNWLLSRFHFTFAEYYDSKRAAFGVLRVLNDDLVQPKRGFGAHPHRDMEIMTYVVDGHLTHKDSMGTEETLDRGAIQFMSAGSGVVHSEHNLHETQPLRFIQIWITPRARGITPVYGSFRGDAKGRQNRWQHLVSNRRDESTKTPVKVDQDVNLFVSELQNQELTFELGADRQLYIVCVEGAGEVKCDMDNTTTAVERHDGARAYGPATFTFKPAKSGAHFLLLEMKKDTR